MSSAGRAVSSNGCVTKPRSADWFDRLRRVNPKLSLMASYVMETGRTSGAV